MNQARDNDVTIDSNKYGLYTSPILVAPPRLPNIYPHAPPVANKRPASQSPEDIPEPKRRKVI